MLQFLKYLPALAAGKDVAKAYKEETGKDKPIWMSGRMIGAVVALAGVLLAISQGITLDPATLSKLSDNLTAIAGALFTIYGIVRAIIGQIQASKRKTEAPAPAEGTGDGQGNTDGQV